jgi:transcription elongation factor SPT6
MEAVANNKKFFRGPMEELEKKLRADKEKDEAIIPYGFCVTDKAP